MKTSRVLIAGIPAAGLLAFCNWQWLAGDDGPKYRTAAVERGSIETTISTTGTCNSVVTVQVGSQVSGRIMALHADYNTEVKAGQLLARIDPATFEARLDQAAAPVTLDLQHAMGRFSDLHGDFVAVLQHDDVGTIAGERRIGVEQNDS